MASPENSTSGRGPPTDPDSSVSIPQLVLRIDQSRMQEVVDEAKHLPSEDRQLVVDFLSKALEKDGILSNNADRALPLLAKIASSTNVFPTCRTLKSLPYEPKPGEEDGNTQDGGPGTHVKILKRSKNKVAYSEAVITWAHLSHPNILPLYGVFFEKQENFVYLVSSRTVPGNISTYSKTLPQPSRMPLISDLADGLCYLHQLNIAHGGLNPRAVLVSDDRRALIADLDALFETQDPESSSGRYSAPELLKQGNPRPTIAADMWSFGCVVYEVLSGNVPYCQHQDKVKIGAAVGRGEKSIRPGQEGVGGEEIDVTMWRSILKFWEISPGNRLSSSEFQQSISSPDIQFRRYKAGPLRSPRGLELVDDLSLDHERARALLTQLLPSTIQIPEDILRTLSGLIRKKLEDVVAAKDEVCVDDADTHVLLDFLAMVIKQDILTLPEQTRIQELHSRINKPTLAGNMKPEVGHPKAEDRIVTGNSRMALSRDIDMHRVEILLRQIQSELLQRSLSVVILNHTKDVAAAAANLNPQEVQTIVDFLDLSLQDNITLSESNRVLAVLSRVSSSTRIFPQRLQIKGVKYNPQLIARGSLWAVHRGRSDPSICVKVLAGIGSGAFTLYMRELIIWAHASHPNILPFYGMFIDESQGVCLVSPFMQKGNLRDYAPHLPQKSRWPLLLDTIKGLDYLHSLGVVHTDIKGENVLISDEGRGLITDFGASHIVTSTLKGGATTTFVAPTLRFTAPELIRDQTSRVRPGQEVDIWSFGCLIYQVLSRQPPYYEYRLEVQVYAALVRGQLPKRPDPVGFDKDDDDDDWDKFDEIYWDDIDETSWNLIVRCCALRPEDRPSCLQIQQLIVDLLKMDSRPEAKGFHDADILHLRSNAGVDPDRVSEALSRIQIEILHSPISKLMQNRIKELASAIEKLDPGDKRTLVDYLDMALANHVTSFEERNRILALLSRIAVTALIFPRRHELEIIPYQDVSFSQGTFATVHRGLSNPNICVKVMKQIDRGPYIKELIFWAHLSHPNVLPFCGAFFNESQQLCLVSPYMKIGNLVQHAFSLLQRSRVPLLSDIIDGLEYLHNMGIVHSDLKPENVLISDEGRALIADHGASHVTTATANQNSRTATPVNYTLCYMAPEIVAGGKRRPTKMADIWSFGCLCYHVLSRKVPYYQHNNDRRITFAVLRGELPMRPGLVTADNQDETDDLWDDFEEEDPDWEELDDELWDLIVKCCKPQPGDRSTIPDIQKIIADMKIVDTRPEAKEGPTAASFKHRFSPEVDLHWVGELLTQIQAQFPSARKEEEDLI